MSRQGIADRQDRFGSAIDANDASLQRAKRAVKIEFAACEHPTGLGRVAGLAVVTVKKSFVIQAVSQGRGQPALDRLVVAAQGPGKRTITIITSHDQPVGALIAGAMQTMAGPLQEQVGAKVDAPS